MKIKIIDDDHRLTERVVIPRCLPFILKLGALTCPPTRLEKSSVSTSSIILSSMCT